MDLTPLNGSKYSYSNSSEDYSDPWENNSSSGADGYGNDYNTGAMSPMGRDQFMHLLITQLQYQDPLSPLSNHEFVAQLAQFSSLEQMQYVNANLQVLQMYEASINNSQAVNLIGKYVEAGGDEISVSDGHADPFRYVMDDEGHDVVVNIYDEDDELVRTVELGTVSEGSHVYRWDGEDTEGNQVEDGVYRVEILGETDSGKAMEIQTLVRMRVSGVSFEDGVVYLKMDDLKIPLSDVVEIFEEEPQWGDEEESEGF